MLNEESPHHEWEIIIYRVVVIHVILYELVLGGIPVKVKKKQRFVNII